MLKTKKIITLLLVCLVIFVPAININFSYADNSNASDYPQVALKLNNTPLTTDVPPIIIDDRTMVPVRAVFEKLGSDISWNNDTRQVQVSYNEKTIGLIIDSNIATVDGEVENLDVPATIVEGRTLVPIRFICESLGFSVNWDGPNQTVLLASADDSKDPPIIPPTPEETPDENNENDNQVNLPSRTINNISISQVDANEPFTRVAIYSSEEFSGYTSDSLDYPNRFFVDFNNSKISEDLHKLDSEIENSPVVRARVGQFDESTARVTVDLTGATKPSVYFSGDNKILYLDFINGFDEAPLIETNPNRTKDPEHVDYDPLADDKYIVILDPGHGQDTAGKRSFDNTLMEYEINRDLANRIKTYLEDRGIEVLFTIEDLRDMPLSERVDKSNSSEADIFVSIHANAYGDTWNDTNGWEVYCYSKNSIAGDLAKSIHDANIPANTLKDRGIKETNNPGLYVIRNATKPAVLIEHGFFTNLTELEKLKNNEFRETLAELDARGICNFLGVEW